MLITESQLGFRSANSLNILDKMSYLTEAESMYSAALVPVVENTSLGANLIRLEDVISFSEANGIEDLGYSLNLICEASQIDPSTVTFTVQEDAILGDPEIAQLTQGIMEAGVGVVALPVSGNYPMCMALDIAVDNLMETGDSAMLEAVADLDFDTFFAEANVASNQVEKYAKDEYKEMDKAAGAAHKANAKTAKNIQGKLETIWQKLKNGVGITRDWLAKGLAWLRQKALAVEAAAKKEPANKRGIWDKIKGAIAHAIEVITRKLHNFVQANRGEMKVVNVTPEKKAKK